MLSLFDKGRSGWLVHHLDLLPQLVPELWGHLPHLLLQFFPLTQLVFLLYHLDLVLLESDGLGLQFVLFADRQ